MSYLVVMQPPAEEDAEAAYLYLRRKAPLAAKAWIDGLIAAVATLSSMPDRCPLAPESDVFDEEIRQLLYGSYRVLFTIRGARVHILHVRHGAQDRLQP